MRPVRRDKPPAEILLGIAGLPSTEEEKKYIRQASLMLRYRLWMRGTRPEPVSASEF